MDYVGNIPKSELSGLEPFESGGVSDPVCGTLGLSPFESPGEVGGKKWSGTGLC